MNKIVKLTNESSRQYFNYVHNRYNEEAARTNSLRTSISIAITSLIVTISAGSKLYDGFSFGQTWVHFLCYAFFAGYLVLFGMSVFNIYSFFTKYQHGYPVASKKAKHEILKAINYYDTYYKKCFSKKISKDILIENRVNEYFGDTYSKYLDINHETNNKKALILVGMWKNIIGLIIILIIIFSINSIAFPEKEDSNKGDSNMTEMEDKSEENEQQQPDPEPLPEPPPLDLDIEGSLVTEGAKTSPKKVIPRPKENEELIDNDSTESK